MYCKNCGNKLRTNSVFCSKCGKKVDKEIVDASFLENVENKSQSSVETKHKDTLEDTNGDMMYCRSCGKKIDVKSKICPKCGYNLQNSSTVDPFTNFIICAVSFLFPLIGFILWLVMRSENSSKAKNALIASCAGVFTGLLFLFLIVIFVIVVLVMM